MDYHHILKYVFLWICSVLFYNHGLLFAQQKEYLDSMPVASSDIKVGVVLSGGGAKGLAHIGALKVIEEAGVRIDYISGTSMGAIIGSLYASGYSAKELDSIVRTIDFNVLIQDDLPRNVKTFYERDDAEKYVLTLPFDNFKVGLPSGLSKGQNFFNIFSKLSAHVNHISDFSKLPIPFFCIATNIANGEQVILDEGYLPQAVAASGALPSIFSPVEIDNRLLTDGGVSNNFPVQEIRERGAEVVIGIDVQDSLLPVDALNSVPNIMLQISNFRTIEAMKKNRPITDVYIHPDITEFSVLSFEEADELIENGEIAAMDHYEKLISIQKRQQTPPNKHTVKTPSDSIRINNISIQGNKRYTRAYIKGKLKLKNPEKITYQRLYQGINNLSATGNFDRVNHRVVKKEWGNELVVNVKESDNTMLLRFALHYDDLYKTAGLNNFTKKRLLFNNDVLSLDLILGDNIRYDLSYYIDKGYYWSVGLNHSFNRFRRAVDYENLQGSFELPVIDVNSIAMDFLDVKTQFYAETVINQNFTFGIGAEHRRFRLISETIGEDKDQLPRIVFDNNDYGSAFSYLRFDSYDNKYFPSSGIHFNGELNYYLLHSNENNNENSFALFKSMFGYAFNPFKRGSFILDLGAGARLGGEEIQSFNFFIGGFGAKNTTSTVPFYGYDFLDLNGDSFAKAGLTFDYELFPNNHINASVNYANIGSQLYQTGRWFGSPKYSGYALGYGIETFAGPLQIKYSYSPELKDGEWFFSLGFWF